MREKTTTFGVYLNQKEAIKLESMFPHLFEYACQCGGERCFNTGGWFFYALSEDLKNKIAAALGKVN